MNVRYLEPARAELLDAIAYYENENSLGGDFLSEVERVLSVLRTTPHLGIEVVGARRVVLRRFPYNIVYAAEDGELVIIALAHHRRRPNYWSDRT